MENQKPLSIEQAGNYLKAREKTIDSDIKKDIAKSQISVTPEQDRKAYLQYAVSVLEKVDMEIVRLFARIVNKTPEMFNGGEVAGFLRKILVLKIYGYSNGYIGKIIKELPITVASLEELAIKAVKNEIIRRKSNELPLIGG